MDSGTALIAVVLLVLILIVIAMRYARREAFGGDQWDPPGGNPDMVLYPEAARAIAVIQGDPGVRGRVEFYEPVPGRGTQVTARIAGLAPGVHGFHVHAKGVGSWSPDDPRARCDLAGPHYNPFGHAHAGPEDAARHAGDLGNITAGADGVATYRRTDLALSLGGPYSVLGRAVVVHRDPDDYGRGGAPDSRETGHAGPRVGCGMIVAA
jgi:Cu-Zn family superoxide dismutase